MILYNIIYIYIYKLSMGNIIGYKMGGNTEGGKGTELPK